MLDIHLVQLASRTGCTYSRYADDLTFSTNKPEFPTGVARCVENIENQWIPGKDLERLIKKCGFETNPLKTRMQYCDSRQEVTGLIVNTKVNVRREYRHIVRAMADRLFKTGNFEFIYKAKDEKWNVTENKTDGSMNQLHGMLGFIDGVDLYNRKLISTQSNSKGPSTSSTKKSLYRRFLLFKEFYAAAAPVIICEGKTDNVYILHAIRSLAKAYPQLATISSDGKIKLNVRLYKNSGTSTGRILGLTGGASILANFMLDYVQEMNRFTAPTANHPVIVLVDNDDGMKKINSVLQQIAKKKPTGKEPFFHVKGNLYLVATPLKPGVAESMIEDFFKDEIKKTVLDGKTFDPVNNLDTDTCYGKHVFAQKVVKPQAEKIDFSEFSAILSNMVLVIDEHARTHLPVIPTA